MVKLQYQNLNMFMRTLHVMNDNNTAWSANTYIVGIVTKLDDAIKKIHELAGKQGFNKGEWATEKKNARIVLEKDTYTICRVSQFYVSQTGDTELGEKTNFTRTRLKKARENEITGMAEQVLKAATDKQAAITPYGLTAGMMTALANSIPKFNDLVSEPRTFRREGAKATAQIPGVIKETQEMLNNELDLVMEIFADSEEHFHGLYFITRKVGKPARRTRDLELLFTDAKTVTPIGKAKAVIETVRKDMPVQRVKRKASAKGNVWVQHLPEGNHKLTVTLASYKQQVLDFSTEKNKTTKLVVQMEKQEE